MGKDMDASCMKRDYIYIKEQVYQYLKTAIRPHEAMKSILLQVRSRTIMSLSAQVSTRTGAWESLNAHTRLEHSSRTKNNIAGGNTQSACLRQPPQWILHWILRWIRPRRQLPPPQLPTETQSSGPFTKSVTI